MSSLPTIVNALGPIAFVILLGFLAGRFSFKSWSSGEMAVPETALAHLATEGIRFTVEGPAEYERLISAVRDPAAPTV